MDLKCFECITQEWTQLQGGSASRDKAGDQAAPAITIHGGTALCAKHATYVKGKFGPPPIR